VPTKTTTRRKPAPRPAPQPAPPVTPVAVKAVLCRSDCPNYHKPHGDAWAVRCDDCGTIGYACGACLAAGRVTGCVACMNGGTT
jgi:hypothetical protein